MNIFKTVFGPPSKYDKKIPYTYEARYRIIDGLDDYNSYFSDTICGLISHLQRVGHNPGVIEILEIYMDREVRIPTDLYASDAQNWRDGNDLCQSFKRIYPQHIGNESCTFSDRSQAAQA